MRTAAVVEVERDTIITGFCTCKSLSQMYRFARDMLKYRRMQVTSVEARSMVATIWYVAVGIHRDHLVCPPVSNCCMLA
jgi:hypothetical protein